MGPGQRQGAGPGCPQWHPSRTRPVWVQFRPLPRSQILIRTRQGEVSDPQPSPAPWPPWGPCHVNEEGTVPRVPPRGPAQRGPNGTLSLSWHLSPLAPAAPITTHGRLSRPSSQSLALISRLAGQHGLWPQTDIRPNPGTSASQLGDLSSVASLSAPGFLIYKTGMIRTHTS